MNIPEFSVRNSIFGNMLTIAVFIAGLYAALTMTRELFPETNIGIVVAYTTYRNASPEEVENHVTIPIEEEIRGVDGIDYFISTSTEGSSVITMYLDPDTKHEDRVINDISRKIGRVRGLPDDADDPIVEVIVSEAAVIHITVSGDVSEYAIREAANTLKIRFEAIEGVGSVTRHGWRDPEIWVEADANTLIEKEISLGAISESITRQNVNMPGGKMKKGTKDIILRTVGEFQSIEDIEAVVVRSNADGHHLTVKDVATVRHSFAEDAVVVRANGSRAIVLDVNKKISGDVIIIANKVKDIVAEERKRLTSGVELGIIDFESYVIKRRLRVLLSNGVLGLILVLCSLPLVLNFRLAFLTALGIPFAFFFTLLIMSYVGVTINMITMFGIILVVGMLVDDAIIVSENIFRHMEMGKSRRDAAIDGASEVMWPVITTILTTIAAFAPLMFLPGIMGRMLRWIPIVVIITLSASLFEALVILPCHIAEFGGVVKKKADNAGTNAWAAILDWYARLLARVLRHRFVFVLIILACLFGSVGLAKKIMKFDLFPADLIEIFVVSITAPQGTSQDVTEKLTSVIEQRLVDTLTEDELENYISNVGHISDQHGANVTRGSCYSMITVYLSPNTTRDRSAQEIIAALREACKGTPGVETLGFEMVKGGPPVGKEVQVKIIGDDYHTLDTIATEIKIYLESIEGVKEVKDDHAVGKEELRVVVNRQNAARLGVAVDTVARTVYSAFEGISATSIRSTDEETKIRVRLTDTYRDSVKYLRSLRVRNNAGRLIELSRIMDLEKTTSVTGISHHDGRRAITISAGVEGASGNKGVVAAVNTALWAEFKNIPNRYPGYRIIRSGEGEETEKTKTDMMRAGLTALLLIYTILVVQFKSFAQPFIVLVSIPFSIIGVILALAVHGKPISMMAMLGMVGMCGVVVNDAIVLVSFINDLRRDGVPIQEAITRAAETRFRPIVLTSVTTVLGMAPIIYGIGGYEPFVAPAAIVLAYGLVFATFLTLLVVPCMYSIGADVKAAAARRLRRSPAKESY